MHLVSRRPDCDCTGHLGRRYHAHRAGSGTHAGPAGAGHDASGHPVLPRSALARRTDAHRSTGVHGHALRGRPGASAMALPAAQRRCPGGGVGQLGRRTRHPRPAGADRRALGVRQPRTLRQPYLAASGRRSRRRRRVQPPAPLGARAADRHGLSRGLALRGQRGRAGPFPLPARRHRDPGAAASSPRAACRRVQQPLDPERRGQRRRNQAVRDGRVGNQRGHRRDRRPGPAAGRGAGAQPGRERHEGLRLRPAQPARSRLGAREQHAVDRGERARRPGRRAGAGLPHQRPRRRILRLAVFLLRAATKTRGKRESARIWSPRQSRPTTGSARTRRRSDSRSIEEARSRRRGEAAPSSGSTGRGTARGSRVTACSSCHSKVGDRQARRASS